MRKNYTALTVPEKERFIDACLRLKATDPGMVLPSVGWNDIVQLHINRFAFIHQGPTFLAWHRDFLLRLEDALRATDPLNANVTIPYWDWTLGFPADLTALVGGTGVLSNNYRVTDGPFAHSAGNWNITVDPRNGPELKRSFGLDVGSLPTGLDVHRVLAESIFDTCSWDMTSNDSFRNRLEGFWWIGSTIETRTHNNVHRWVGGNMLTGGSPNDPLFFMNHANVDRIWCQWQKLNPYAFHHLPSGGGTCLDYPPNGTCPNPPFAHTLACADMELMLSPFGPFGPPNRRPVDMLNMRALGFEYDDCVGPCQFGEGGVGGCPCEFGAPGTGYDRLTFSQVMILDGV